MLFKDLGCLSLSAKDALILQRLGHRLVLAPGGCHCVWPFLLHPHTPSQKGRLEIRSDRLMKPARLHLGEVGISDDVHRSLHVHAAVLLLWRWLLRHQAYADTLVNRIECFNRLCLRGRFSGERALMKLVFMPLLGFHFGLDPRELVAGIELSLGPPFSLLAVPDDFLEVPLDKLHRDSSLALFFWLRVKQPTLPCCLPLVQIKAPEHLFFLSQLSLNLAFNLPNLSLELFPVLYAV